MTFSTKGEERKEQWREGGGEDPFHRLNIKKKSSFYLRMKRKQMTDGGAPLEGLNHFHKAIPANSPSIKNLALFTGGQLQMCLLLLEKKRQVHLPLQPLCQGNNGALRFHWFFCEPNDDVIEASDFPPT